MRGTLILELRCEELPHTAIQPALQALRDGTTSLLKGLSFEQAFTYSTPRRLTVILEGLESERPAQVRQLLGPSLSIAQRDGAWTRAAEGFARGKGASVENLQIVEGSQGTSDRRRGSRGRRDGLGAAGGGARGGLVRKLPFRKTMVWGGGIETGSPSPGRAPEGTPGRLWRRETAPHCGWTGGHCGGSRSPAVLAAPGARGRPRGLPPRRS